MKIGRDGFVTIVCFALLTGMLTRGVKGDDGATFGSVDRDGDQVAEDAVLLWEKMRDAGMITDEQFTHVLQHGRLPSGSTVKDSPVSGEQQSSWAALAEHAVITRESWPASCSVAGSPI